MESCRKPDHAVGQPDRSARQARSGLPASPAGDSRTGEGTMIMCVYPVLASSPDEDDRQKGMGPQQRAPRSRGSGKNVFIPPSATQEMIVRQIIAARPAGEQLTTLELVARGDSGMLFLSGADGTPLTVANAQPWAELRPHFSRTAGVIRLRGCGVASD